MDIFRSVVGDRIASVLLSGLIGRGFNKEQAENFLSVAGLTVLTNLQVRLEQVEAESLLTPAQRSNIAAETGVSQRMVLEGLKYIVPGLTDQVGGFEMSRVQEKINQAI